jgi:hypothetical protein
LILALSAGPRNSLDLALSPDAVFKFSEACLPIRQLGDDLALVSTCKTGTSITLAKVLRQPPDVGPSAKQADHIVLVLRITIPTEHQCDVKPKVALRLRVELRIRRVIDVKFNEQLLGTIVH